MADPLPLSPKPGVRGFKPPEVFVDCHYENSHGFSFLRSLTPPPPPRIPAPPPKNSYRSAPAVIIIHGSTGADAGFLKRGPSEVYKQKRGFRKGSNFGPNVKRPTPWAKKGGSGPPGPPPLDSPMIQYPCK